MNYSNWNFILNVPNFEDLPKVLQQLPQLKRDIFVISVYLSIFKRGDLQRFNHCNSEHGINIRIYDNGELPILEGNSFDFEGKDKVLMSLGVLIGDLVNERFESITGLNKLLSVYGLKISTGLVPPPTNELPSYQ